MLGTFVILLVFHKQHFSHLPRGWSSKRANLSLNGHSHVQRPRCEGETPRTFKQGHLCVVARQVRTGPLRPHWRGPSFRSGRPVHPHGPGVRRPGTPAWDGRLCVCAHQHGDGRAALPSAVAGMSWECSRRGCPVLSLGFPQTQTKSHVSRAETEFQRFHIPTMNRSQRKPSGGHASMVGTGLWVCFTLFSVRPRVLWKK